MTHNFRGAPPSKPGQNSLLQQVQVRFQHALAFHQKGQLGQAQVLYQEILNIHPNHFDCLHLLGIIAYQTGQLDLGARLITDAIRVNPHVAAPHSNLGLVFQKLKRLDEALTCYDKALALDPANAEAYYNRGNALLDLKRPNEALACYDQALALNPANAEAHNNRGNTLLELKRPAEALACYDKTLALKPGYPEAYNNRGNALLNLKRPDEALACYDKALSLNPSYTEAYNNRGIALLDLKRPDEALACYHKALALNPGYAEAYYNAGNALRDLKRPDEALACYGKALALNPGYTEAYYNAGNALRSLTRPDEALACYGKALTLNPDYAEAHNNRGNALLDLKRPDEALASYQKALTFKPDSPEVNNNLGNALLDLKRPEEALVYYDKALAIKPDYPEAHNNRGNALMNRRQPEASLACYDKALALNPDYAEAHNNRGNALLDLKRPDAALDCYNKALALNPAYPEAYNNLGNALLELKRPDAALACYDKALALNPSYPEAHYNRGNTLLALKRPDEAQACYGQALALKPDYEFVFGMYLHTKMKLCDWELLSDHLHRYEAEITRSKPVTTPFPALSLIDFPELHKVAAQVYAEAKFPKRPGAAPIAKRPPDGKIRLGYYSADFHNHATSYLMAELFEAHDTSKFKVFGFSFGPDRQDEMRARVSAAFGTFIDVRDKSAREVAELSRNLGIDIAVDLKGYTQDNRAEIFAEGCAPIQVNYLGYPGTLGAGHIDYIIADRIVIPEASQADFTEKVVYLPHSYLVNDSKRKISERVFTRAAEGLPDSGFVFCCFNNSYKILPATFAGWMRILQAVEDSVLWLLEDNDIAAKHLRKEAETRGVDSGRLVFAKRMKLDEHLARHRLADLFIDTLPYNAHTTASDSLWAGLPVLTYMGKSFASRVSASLLNAVDLPELITHTQTAYETKAIELATNPDKLQEIKRKLEKNRLTTPLFNGKLFARHIETAYESMYARHQADLPAEGFEVKP